MSAIEPQVPLGSQGLVTILIVIFLCAVVVPFVGTWVLYRLRFVACWAAVTVLVFLRKDMGTRAVSFGNIITGILFLYFVGNMIGHNYHDVYRDVGATIWGARIHFTYLVLFIMVAAYRKVVAWQHVRILRPSGWGSPSYLAELLPTNSRLAPRGEFYLSVVRDPLAVVSIGLILALVLRNWFGWYLVLTGCLCFYELLYEYYDRHEAFLDSLDNPQPKEPKG